jgi:hypothetical protein
MLRSDFESHGLWGQLGRARALADVIRDEHQPSDLPYLETLDLYAKYLAEFRELSATFSFAFTGPMLDPMMTEWVGVGNSLDLRIANGPSYWSYVQTASQQAEGSLMYIGPWPRPFARGRQVSSQQTLYEGLLETQRQSIAALEAEHAALRAEVAAYRTQVGEDRDAAVQAVADLIVQADAVAETVDGQKARIDTVVTDGLQAVSEIPKSNEAAYGEWIKDRATKFESDFAPLGSSLEAMLEEGTAKLELLRTTESEYNKLVSAVGAGTLAKDFMREARWGRVAGIAGYALGILLLGVAALPLAYLLDTSNNVGPTWQQIVLRLSIGVLGASAATVSIRLGGRFIASANANKRMELELRAFYPFLAKVEDRESVDLASIQLVDRTFGKSYAPESPEKDEETLPVSTFSQIIASVAKLVGR